MHLGVSGMLCAQSRDVLPSGPIAFTSAPCRRFNGSLQLLVSGQNWFMQRSGSFPFLSPCIHIGCQQPRTPLLLRYHRHQLHHESFHVCGRRLRRTCWQLLFCPMMCPSLAVFRHPHPSHSRPAPSGDKQFGDFLVTTFSRLMQKKLIHHSHPSQFTSPHLWQINSSAISLVTPKSRLQLTKVCVIILILRIHIEHL